MNFLPQKTGRSRVVRKVHTQSQTPRLNCLHSGIRSLVAWSGVAILGAALAWIASTVLSAATGLAVLAVAASLLIFSIVRLIPAVFSCVNALFSDDFSLEEFNATQHGVSAKYTTVPSLKSSYLQTSIDIPWSEVSKVKLTSDFGDEDGNKTYAIRFKFKTPVVHGRRVITWGYFLEKAQAAEELERLNNLLTRSLLPSD